MPETTLPEKPDVKALLLCDRVQRDSATGKFTIMGVFDRIWARAFPANQGEFGVYANVTNMNGSYLFSIQFFLARPEGDEQLAELRGQQPHFVRDPLARIELGFNLPGILLPQAGRYYVRLVANEQQLQDLALTVAQQPESGT